jgi:hypothetical protein
MEGKGRKRFFFEKKKQKTFVRWSICTGQRTASPYLRAQPVIRISNAVKSA